MVKKSAQQKKPAVKGPSVTQLIEAADHGKKTEEDRTPPPPLYISCSGAWVEVYDIIVGCCKKEVGIELVNSNATISLQAATKSDHRALKSAVAAFIVDAPPLQATSEGKRAKYTRALLKGLPWCCDEAAVREGLRRAGFGGVTAKLHNRTNRTRPPLYVVAVQTVDDGGDVFALRKLLGFPVTVEALPADMDPLPQCFRCQGVGHVAKYCRNAARCVKCSGEHDTRDCVRGREETPTCARCGGPHVANWRGCPAFSSRSQPGGGAAAAAAAPHGRRKRRRRRRRGNGVAAAPPDRDRSESTANGGADRPRAERGPAPSAPKKTTRPGDDLRVAAEEATAAFKAAMAAERVAFQAQLAAERDEVCRQIRQLHAELASDLYDDDADDDDAEDATEPAPVAQSSGAPTAVTTGAPAVLQPQSTAAQMWTPTPAEQRAIDEFNAKLKASLEGQSLEESLKKSCATQ